ncbi:hypothetical protein TNCV_2200361 [Trichonephila clavipes]|nr:hypothetical protein TNCV_2200361 [Trichonephila clavipes]
MPVVIRSYEHQYNLARIHPNFEGEHPEGGQGSPTSLPVPPTLREYLWLDGYLPMPHSDIAERLSRNVSNVRDCYEQSRDETALRRPGSRWSHDTTQREGHRIWHKAYRTAVTQRNCQRSVTPRTAPSQATCRVYTAAPDHCRL